MSSACLVLECFSLSDFVEDSAGAILALDLLGVKLLADHEVVSGSAFCFNREGLEIALKLLLTTTDVLDSLDWLRTNILDDLRWVFIEVHAVNSPVLHLIHFNYLFIFD